MAGCKQHRAILDSDLLHLRRADGRDWDGWMHVNVLLEERGLAMFYNPLPVAMERNIKLPLYYTGLTESAVVQMEDGKTARVPLARDCSATLSVTIPAMGRTWLIVRAP
jgi:hypothetical protein